MQTTPRLVKLQCVHTAVHGDTSHRDALNAACCCMCPHMSEEAALNVWGLPWRQLLLAA